MGGRYSAAAKITFSTSRMARQFVYAERPYADWLPYDRTLRRAQLFFNKKGAPFSNLESADKAVLLELHATRNAIAHLSRHAQRQFEQAVDTRLLRPSELRPAPYLRSNFSVGTTRYENAVGELIRMSKKIDPI